MLTKNARAGLAAREVLRYPLTTASLALREVARSRHTHRRPPVRPTLLRLRVLGSYLRLLPVLVRRRRIAPGRRSAADAWNAGWCCGGVGLDATPLLGPRTGVGRYVARLAGALATLAGPEPEELALVPFSLAGHPRAAGRGPGRATQVRYGRRRAPARLLQAAWSRLPWPPVEWAGPVEVFHGTNFVAPPTRRAATVVTVHDLTYLASPRW